jgi:hypothetical protein
VKWTVRYLILVPYPINGTCHHVSARSAENAIKKVCDRALKLRRLHASAIRYADWSAEVEK